MKTGACRAFLPISTTTGVTWIFSSAFYFIENHKMALETETLSALTKWYACMNIQMINFSKNLVFLAKLDV
jgi:hypothetical protein